MTTRRCEADGCLKDARGRERYCTTHVRRKLTNGHPLALTPSDRLRRQYTAEARHWISRTLTLAPTQAALGIAEEVLQINPRPDTRAEADAQGWLIRAVDAGLTPQLLLERTVGIFWLLDNQHDGFGHRYSVEQENATVAHWILRLVRRGRHERPGIVGVRYLGDQLRRGLARYALALLTYRRETEEARQALVDQSAYFPSPKDAHEPC